MQQVRIIGELSYISFAIKISESAMKRSKLRHSSDDDEEEEVYPKKVKRKTKMNKKITRQKKKTIQTSESDTEIEIRRKKRKTGKKKTSKSKKASKREEVSSESETESESEEEKFPTNERKSGHKKTKKCEKVFKREKESSESETQDEKILAKKRKSELTNINDKKDPKLNVSKTNLIGKPYKCDAKNCDKNYTTAQGLSRHKKSHREKWFFSCPHCEKGFDRSDHCNRHQKSCPENPQKPSTEFITAEQLKNALSNFQITMVNKLQGNELSLIILNHFYLFRI